MKSSENAARIYVGTYGMYNSGSLFGKWFDLNQYADAKEFYHDCYDYHRNEFDPELMLQDWENIPDFLISECSLDNKAFEYFQTLAWEWKRNRRAGREFSGELSRVLWRIDEGC